MVFCLNYLKTKNEQLTTNLLPHHAARGHLAPGIAQLKHVYAGGQGAQVELGFGGAQAQGDAQYHGPQQIAHLGDVEAGGAGIGECQAQVAIQRRGRVEAETRQGQLAAGSQGLHSQQVVFYLGVY